MCIISGVPHPHIATCSTTVNVTGGYTLEEMNDGATVVADSPGMTREVGQPVSYTTKDGHTIDGYVRAIEHNGLRLLVAFS
jgi:hypothetical protein